MNAAVGSVPVMLNPIKLLSIVNARTNTLAPMEYQTSNHTEISI